MTKSLQELQTINALFNPSKKAKADYSSKTLEACQHTRYTISVRSVFRGAKKGATMYINHTTDSIVVTCEDCLDEVTGIDFDKIISVLQKSKCKEVKK
jgi:hypothetical protein